MSQKFVDGVITLSKLNPNKLTVIEELALNHIENKVHRSLKPFDSLNS